MNWSEFYTPYKERFVKNRVPTGPGIYALYVLMENQKWSCFFVGNSENLKASMMHHLNEEENPKIKENIQDYICGFEYASEEDAAKRAAAVKYMFDELKPENMDDPGGKGIRVNIEKIW
ncbi:MAG: hypothetical protein AAF573_20025 [Bacteroidota bacterium]